MSISVIAPNRDLARLSREVAQELGEDVRVVEGLLFIWDGVVAVDRDNRVVLFNPVAESIMGIPARDARGKDVREVIPNTRLHEVVESDRPQLADLQEVRGVTIVTNRVPILVDGKVLGAVATFQEVGKLQKLEQNVRMRLAEKGLVAKYRLEESVGVRLPPRNTTTTGFAQSATAASTASAVSKLRGPFGHTVL